MKRPISILVVEDDVIICEDIRTTLIKLGYALIDTVTSGEEAILKVEEKRPDFVLMDIVLSGQLNGIETGELIFQKFGTPIIFLSAYTDSITMKRAEQANPYGYLSKPFHKAELKSILEVAIEKRKKDQSLPGRKSRNKIKD